MERSITLMNATSVDLKNLPVSPGGYSEQEPPDPISNSEVKMFCADGRVAVAMPE
jgi:hypothetical protein